MCTGALLLGAAGLLVGRRVTSHWAVHHLLPWFGATPVDARVVRDGAYLFAAGVTAGIDGALRLAADLRGQAAAERIQLDIAYAPDPPFDSGTPDSAPTDVLSEAWLAVADRADRRLKTAMRIGKTLGIELPEGHGRTAAFSARLVMDGSI